MKNRNNQAFNAILVTKGRNTGKEHSVWLRVVMYDNKLYFSRLRPDGDWFKNALANQQVRVEIDNTRFNGKASLVKNELLAQKISELKYPGQDRAKEKRVVLEVALYQD